jgi:hypothetical protein
MNVSRYLSFQCHVCRSTFTVLQMHVVCYLHQNEPHNMKRHFPSSSKRSLFCYYFLWLCSPERAMASCGSAAQRGLWPPVALQPSAGYGLLWLCSPARAMASSFTRFLDHTPNDAPQSVVLLRTNDQLVAETSTWQHTTHTRDKHPCPRWDSNPRSQ